MKVIALDTLQYPEYRSPNWIEGNDYELEDDGSVLMVSSEQGTNFRFMGDARRYMLTQFEGGSTGEGE